MMPRLTGFRTSCRLIVLAVSVIGANHDVFSQQPDLTKALREYDGHTNVVAAVGFSPDGNRIFSGSWDETVRLWDAHTGAQLRYWDQPTDWIETLAVSADGRTLTAASQRAVHRWNLEEQQHEATWDFHGQESTSVVALSPHGRWLACGVRNGTVTVWEVGTQQLQWTFTTDAAWTKCLAFSPDEKQLVAGDWLGKIRIWELVQGREVRSFQGHVDAVASAVCFSPDGGELASGGYDGTIKRWDIPTGEMKTAWADHKGLVLSLAYSPDSRYLASGERHGPIKLWNLGSQEMVMTYRGHPDAKLGFSVVALAFAPDGRSFVSAGYDQAVRLWVVPEQ